MRTAPMVLDFEVSSPGGLLCTVFLDPEDTLRDLRDVIEANTGIEAIKQRLIHGVQELADEQCLGEMLHIEGECVHVELLLLRRTPEQVALLEKIEKLGWDDVSSWLSHASSDVHEDRDVILASVSLNGHTLGQAADELRADRQVVLAAVAQTGLALRHAALSARADREVALAAVAHNGLALQHVSPELQADRDVVLTAVLQTGQALQHAAPVMQADKEVVLAAVADTGWALQFAAPEVREDKKIVLTAMSQDFMALEHSRVRTAAMNQVLHQARENQRALLHEVLQLSKSELGARILRRPAGAMAPIAPALVNLRTSVGLS